MTSKPKSKSEAKRLKVQKKVAELEGKITSINSDSGFGFILGEDNTEYFFHKSMVDGGNFSALFAGDSVRFNPLLSAKGPRAVGVRLTT